MGRPALHFHLSHLHNVVPECVEKLLLVVSTGWVWIQPWGRVRPGQEGQEEKQRQGSGPVCVLVVVWGVLVKETAFHRFEGGC